MTGDTRVKAILVDIDGVICDVPYEVTPEDFLWEKFMVADLDRKPINAGNLLVHQLVDCGGLYPVFLTARPEFMRYQTEKMLAEYGHHGLCHMASNESAEKGGGVNYQSYQMIEKARIICENKLQDEFDFVYAIDDQEENAKLFKGLGIPTLQARFL